MMRHSLFAAVGLFCAPPIILAQPSDVRRDEMLLGVMEFRYYSLGDATRFHACSAYDRIGKPERFMAGFDSTARTMFVRMLDRDVATCADTASQLTRGWGRCLFLDSITLKDSTHAMLRLTVRSGELLHWEDHLLVYFGSRRRSRWVVTEMRAHSLQQELPVGEPAACAPRG